jgi:hypothetical protein
MYSGSSQEKSRPKEAVRANIYKVRQKSSKL